MDLRPYRGKGEAHFGDFLFERFEGDFAALYELVVGLLIVAVDGEVGQVNKVVLHVHGWEGVFLCTEPGKSLAVDKGLKGMERGD